MACRGLTTLSEADSILFNIESSELLNMMSFEFSGSLFKLSRILSTYLYICSFGRAGTVNATITPAIVG